MNVLPLDNSGALQSANLAAGLAVGPDASEGPPIPIEDRVRAWRPWPLDVDSSSFEAQFDRILKSLSRQLEALERTFASAMKNLARGIATCARGAQTAMTQPDQAGMRAPSRFAHLVDDAAKRYELDPTLLSAVIRQESGFAPDARSSAGAMGLMQLMPGTAAALGVTNPWDPRQNTDGGARLLRRLIDRYDGRLDLALAAYNAGPEAVDKYGGVPPYRETRAYVQSILSLYRQAALQPGAA